MNFNQNMDVMRYNQGLNDTKYNRLMGMANMGYGATNAMVQGAYGSANQMGGYATGTPVYIQPQQSVGGAAVQGGLGFAAGYLGNKGG